MIRVAMVGAGGMGRLHLGNLLRHDDVEIAGVCDERVAAAAEMAASCGAKAYAGTEELLSSERVDAAYVCVPPFAHGPVERALAAAGVSLFIEKPVAADPATGLSVLDAVKAAGVITSVGYHWRYADPTRWAAEAIGDSRVLLAAGWWLGTTPGVGWWRRSAGSGGQVTEQATHIVDLARLLLGEVVSVQADQASLLISERYPDADIPDVGTALLRFESGALGVLSNTCSLDHGSTVGLDVFADTVVLQVRSGTLVEERRGDVRTRHGGGSPMEREDEAFLAAVRTKDRSGIQSTYEDALATLAVTHAIKQAAEQGRRVALSEGPEIPTENAVTAAGARPSEAARPQAVGGGRRAAPPGVTVGPLDAP